MSLRRLASPAVCRRMPAVAARGTIMAAPARTLLTATNRARAPESELDAPKSRSAVGRYLEKRFGGSASLLRRRAKWYAVTGGVGVAAYVVLKTGYSTASFFSSIDFFDIARVSFIAGMGSTAALGGVLVGASRAVRLRPEPAFQAVLRAVQRSPEVTRALGSRAEAGAYRAYSFVDQPTPLERMLDEADEEAEEQERAEPDKVAEPKERAASLGRRAARGAVNAMSYWRPANVQVMFAVEGDSCSGMVAAVVEKRGGRMVFRLLTVDVTETGERIVLEGDKNERLYAGMMKLR